MGLRNWTVLSPVGQDSNARTVPTKIHPTASRFLPAGGLGSGPSNRATGKGVIIYTVYYRTFNLTLKKACSKLNTREISALNMQSYTRR